MNRPKEDFPVWSITPTHLYLCDSCQDKPKTETRSMNEVRKEKNCFAIFLELIVLSKVQGESKKNLQ